MPKATPPAAALLWEPRGKIGAEIVNGPRALALTQLNTGDPESGFDD